MKLGTVTVRVPRARGLLRSRLGPAGSRGQPTRTLRRFPRAAHRAPLCAGLLVLALFASAATLPDRFGRARPDLVAMAGKPPIPEAATIATSNVRAQPDPRGDVVAVLPAGRRPELLGRTADGGWLLVAIDGSSEGRGWLPADRLALPDVQRDTLEVMAAPEMPAAHVEAGGALPDLTLGSVYLLRDGRIALDIRNDGEGTLHETRIGLLVTRASGETVGVLEVGPTALGARGVATVVTPIVVTSTGTYTFELDRQESIVEAARTNNSVTRLLVVGGG